jgi:hypothetical protein
MLLHAIVTVQADISVEGFFSCSIDPNSKPTSPFGLMACLGGSAPQS